MLEDLRAERSATVPFPPGETRLSMARTRRFANEPLPMLLDAYERFGPMFTLRMFHGNVVFMLGPAANHYITVSHASNFIWRDGHFRDLIGLMGDGLLTIDGDFHRRSRLIMLPAFHREHIAASAEASSRRPRGPLEQLTPGEAVDLYAWTRRLALRVAMRALFGARPRRRAGARDRRRRPVRGGARLLLHRLLPARPARTAARRGHACRRPRASSTRSSTRRSPSRRATGERGLDILSLLLDAHDEDGNTLTDLQIRDEVMTLLFAGHDTTTSTVSFMFYELARHPDIVARLLAEQDAARRGRPTRRAAPLRRAPRARDGAR